MMNGRHEREFAAQFRWEADRLVFRYKCRAAPVEVSPAERERAVERYSIYSRRAVWATLGLYMALAAGITWVPASPNLPLGGLHIASMAVAVACGWTLINWAWDAPTIAWRSRRKVGFRLGLLGGWIMRVEAMPVWQLGTAWLSWALMLLASRRGENGADWAMTQLLLWAAGVLLAATTLVKWAAAERQRLRKRRTHLWDDGQE